MPRPLLEVARTRVVLGDGGIGTELQAAGLAAGACGEAWNLTHPDRVRQIHQSYRDAGAEVLLTNSFGGSRQALDRHGCGAQTREINHAAAALAREVVGSDGWVLGDIGPFGGFLQPLGEQEPEPLERAFREQAEALLEGGADGILIETMSALDELTVAVRGARAAGAPFIIASLAFDATNVGARTMMGVSPEAAADEAVELGVDALGVNCGAGLGIDGYADILRRYRRVAPRSVLLCRPNAGTPRLVQDDVVYDLTPADLAARVDLLTDAGATLIGGCCGTKPAHIAALRAALNL